MNVYEKFEYLESKGWKFYDEAFTLNGKTYKFTMSAPYNNADIIGCTENTLEALVDMSYRAQIEEIENV